MIESSYTVKGMACGHCAAFVTEEIERIAGVATVTVDVDSDRVVVTSDRDLDAADVRAAVEEIGYEVTT